MGQRKNFLFGQVVPSFLFIILLSGCGSGKQDYQKRVPMKKGYDREQLAKNFKLFDESGRESAPVESRTKTAPFCVLLETTAIDYGICGCSQIAPRLVLTNAHCVDNRNSLNISRNYYILAYGRTAPRERIILHPSGIRYVGTKGWNDIALLTLSENDSLQMDVFEGKRKDTRSWLGSPATEQMIIWTFDPVNSKQAASARFHPKRCKYSRFAPSTRQVTIKSDGTTNQGNWVSHDGKSYELERGGRLTIDSAKQFFATDCSDASGSTGVGIIKGNSGSLATTADFTEAIGAIFARFPDENEVKKNILGDITYFDGYKTIEGKEENFPMFSIRTFFPGTVFDQMLKEMPLAFDPVN